MWNYSQKVMDYFRNPKNVGEIKDADGVGEVGSMACGDALTLYIKVDEHDRITDARFKTFGCASAIASSSVLTEMIIGKTVDEAARITNKDIADFLGGLPEEKMHCSVLGREALLAAVADYRGEPRESLESPLVCECFGVHREELERAIRDNHLMTREQVTHYTKAGGGCGKCHDRIEEILREVWKEAPPEESPSRKPLTNLQKIRLVEEVIEQHVRPQLQKDGGDIDLIDVDGNRVMISFRGMCANCPSTELTVRGIQDTLREFVTPELLVEEEAAP